MKSRNVLVFWYLTLSYFVQLSLFSMFYEILSDQRTLQSEEYKNIVQFLTKILHGFFKKLKDQPFLFVEILFWKTRRECNMISTDQLLSEMNKWKNKGNHSMKKNIADALGDDEADGINKWKSTELPSKKNIADALGDDEADMPIGEPPNRRYVTVLGNCRYRIESFFYVLYVLD